MSFASYVYLIKFDLLIHKCYAKITARFIHLSL